MASQLVAVCLTLLVLDLILIWRLWIAQRVRKDFQNLKTQGAAKAAGHRLILSQRRGK